MFGKKNEKLETLKELIGTRAGYVETVEMLELKGDEKDLFMRASLEVKKNTPNLAIIERAHAILVRKSFQGETGEGTESNINDNDNNPPPKKKNTKAPSSNHTSKGDESTSSRHANYASNAEGDVKNDINYGSLNYKPQRKSYIKYITVAVAVAVVGVYFFINSNAPVPEVDTIESKIQKHGYSKISNKTISYKAYKAQRIVKPMYFELTARLGDYYNYEYGNLQSSYYNIRMREGGKKPTIEGYAPIRSKVGQKIFNILKDGEVHDITVKMHFDSLKSWEHDMMEIDDVY